MQRLLLRHTDLIHQTHEGTVFIGRTPEVKEEEEEEEELGGVVG